MCSRIEIVFDRTTAVTGPPPKNYDFKTQVTGGSRSPHGYLPSFGASSNFGSSYASICHTSLYRRVALSKCAAGFASAFSGTFKQWLLWAYYRITGQESESPGSCNPPLPIPVSIMDQ
jgi:hypothetical protein